MVSANGWRVARVCKKMISYQFWMWVFWGFLGFAVGQSSQADFQDQLGSCRIFRGSVCGSHRILSTGFLADVGIPSSVRAFLFINFGEIQFFN
jgi:hypothetical protein